MSDSNSNPTTNPNPTPTAVSRMSPRPLSPSERAHRLEEGSDFVATAAPPVPAASTPEPPARVEAPSEVAYAYHQTNDFPTPWLGKSSEHTKQAPFRMFEDEKEMLNFLGDTTYGETNQSIFLSAIRTTMATLYRQRGYVVSQDPATGKLTVTAPKKRK